MHSPLGKSDWGQALNREFAIEFTIQCLTPIVFFKTVTAEPLQRTRILCASFYCRECSITILTPIPMRISPPIASIFLWKKRVDKVPK